MGVQTGGHYTRGRATVGLLVGNGHRMGREGRRARGKTPVRNIAFGLITNHVFMSQQCHEMGSMAKMKHFSCHSGKKKKLCSFMATRHSRTP